jgi:hypothetical protein
MVTCLGLEPWTLWREGKFSWVSNPERTTKWLKWPPLRTPTFPWPKWLHRPNQGGWLTLMVTKVTPTHLQIHANALHLLCQPPITHTTPTTTKHHHRSNHSQSSTSNETKTTGQLTGPSTPSIGECHGNGVSSNGSLWCRAPSPPH